MSKKRTFKEMKSNKISNFNNNQKIKKRKFQK